MTGIPQTCNIKSSIVTENTLPRSKSSFVTLCQVCGWYGYPQEKIIIEFEGIRSEGQGGFVDIFTEYDYETETGEKGNKHIHKYDLKLVQESLDLALRMRNCAGSCQ
jgi:hypothetical protein